MVDTSIKDINNVAKNNSNADVKIANIQSDKKIEEKGLVLKPYFMTLKMGNIKIKRK